MKYLPLVWAGLWRKRTRTIFTLLSIVVAFLLFGMLQGVSSAFNAAVTGANLNRLYVGSKYSMIEDLPLSMRAQIERVPGVTSVSYSLWFGGYYQDIKNNVFSQPVEPEAYFRLYPELNLPKDQLDAFIRTRTGAVVDTLIAQKYGWKIGDRVSLGSPRPRADGQPGWPFDIVGIFVSPDGSQANTLFFSVDYYNEAVLPGLRDRAQYFIAGIDSPAHADRIAADIDKLFANSPNETRTQNEKEYAQAFLKQIGDISFIVTAIVGAVFFTLLFLTGNTMMQSVRERIPELAVLKTLGFTDGAVVALVIAEAAILCLVAAVIGLGLAQLVFPIARDIVGVTTLPLPVVATGLALAVAVAAVSALPPALRAKRLSIIDALARR